MKQYTELLKKAIDEISRVFNKRSSQKITGNDRGALLIPNQNELTKLIILNWLPGW